MTDNAWWTLRKEGAAIYVAYGLNPGANLYANGIQMKKGPPVTISMDLEANRSKRVKLASRRIDAEDLAEKISELKSIELRDSHVLRNLRLHLKFTDNPTPPWRLVLILEGEHDFRVDPEYRDRPDTLILKVVES